MGPSGYYSNEKLRRLLEQSGFIIDSHQHVPGRWGSAIWELGVLGYLRFGGFALWALTPFGPMVRLLDRGASFAAGCEHVIRAIRPDDA
jgi:hypothetical protein